MAILPDNVKIKLGNGPQKSSRGYEPVITFSRFYVRGEDRRLTAARVRGENVLKVRKFWTNAEVHSGDWIILEGNGNIQVMTDEDFLELLAR